MARAARRRDSNREICDQPRLTWIVTSTFKEYENATYGLKAVGKWRGALYL